MVITDYRCFCRSVAEAKVSIETTQVRDWNATKPRCNALNNVNQDFPVQLLSKDVLSWLGDSIFFLFHKKFLVYLRLCFFKYWKPGRNCICKKIFALSKRTTTHAWSITQWRNFFKRTFVKLNFWILHLFKPNFYQRTFYVYRMHINIFSEA